MKKRFIVVSLYGYVIDYGVMEESEIIQEAKKMIDVNKSQKIGDKFLSPIINNIPDLFILVWTKTDYKVVTVL